MTDYFKNHNNEYDIFVVTDKNPGVNHLGFTFIFPSDICKYDYDYILVTSKKYFVDIKEELICKYHIDKLKIELLDNIYNKMLCDSFKIRLYIGKSGLEIGDPTGLFKETIYPVADIMDGGIFCADTVRWTDTNKGKYRSRGEKH